MCYTCCIETQYFLKVRHCCATDAHFLFQKRKFKASGWIIRFRRIEKNDSHSILDTISMAQFIILNTKVKFGGLWKYWKMSLQLPNEVQNYGMKVALLHGTSAETEQNLARNSFGSLENFGCSNLLARSNLRSVSALQWTNPILYQ